MTIDHARTRGTCYGWMWGALYIFVVNIEKSLLDYDLISFVIHIIPEQTTEKYTFQSLIC